MASWTTIEYVRTINQTFYDQVKTADQKAGYVFTFLTILFVYTKDPRNTIVWASEPTMSIKWFMSVLFVLCAGFSIACAALVILPRSKSGGSALYWGAWGRPDSPDHNISADLTDEYIIGEYLRNVKNLAHICRIKFKYVGLAFRGTAATIACHIWLLTYG